MSFDTMEPYGPVLDTTTRVVTWNVWGRFGDWQARQDLIADTLRGIEPDIVCLQEAWRTDDATQAAVLADTLGHHHVMAGDFVIDGQRSGQAVLSRWPIVEHEYLEIEGSDGGDGGAALFGRIDGPRGAIDVICLVLEWRLDLSHVRAAQLAEILTWTKERSERRHPLFLCGDFNAPPDADELRALVGQAPVHVPRMVFYDAMAAAPDPAAPTFTHRNPLAAVALMPELQLDHIFSQWPKAHGAGHPVDARLIGDQPRDGVWASDHFGIMADLRY